MKKQFLQISFFKASTFYEYSVTCMEDVQLFSDTYFKIVVLLYIHNRMILYKKYLNKSHLVL